MPEAPKDAKVPIGCTDFGVDAKGESVHFGFKLQDGSIANFVVSHGSLAEIVRYIQHIASVAQDRRLSVDPAASDKEVRATSRNPVQKIDFLSDIEGQSALVEATTSSGAPVTFQLPFDLVTKLYEHLPSLIAEMRTRQSQKKGAH